VVFQQTGQFLEQLSKFEYVALDGNDEHVLAQACILLDALQALIGKMPVVEGSDLAVALQEACNRFQKSVDSAGLTWLKQLMHGSASKKEKDEMAKKIISKPTTFLVACMETFSLCDDDVSSFEVGSKVTDLIALVPLLNKITSIDTGLMKQLSEDRLALCETFLQDYLEKLRDHVQSLVQATDQLQKIDEKYKCLGIT